MIWSFILTGVGLMALWLIGKKIIWGWAIGIGLQFLWFAYATSTEQYGFIASCILYGYVNTKNFVEWRRDERKDMGRDSDQRSRIRA